MANYGVVDVGSNTIRLEVYEVHGTRIDSVLDTKVMAGLASYVANGVFSQQGIDRAIEVIDEHLAKAKYYKCKRLDIFATAVIRNATNCETVLKAIEKGCGCKINLVSGEEEARLGFAGATVNEPIKEGALLDIGGGSSELTLAEGGKPVQSTSIPQGSLTTFARYVDNVLPTSSEIGAIRECISLRLEADSLAHTARTSKLYGIGGSIRACAKLVQQHSERTKRPNVITREEVSQLIQLCEQDVHGFVRLAVKASAERVHTVVPGAIILETLMEHLGAEEIRICEHGIREGYLVTKML